MADKPISELVGVTDGRVTPLDLFVLEQDGTAKKLTGQELENWLLSFAEGHGGIQSILKTGSAGLTDGYTITFSDLSTSSFTVTNGRGITLIARTATSGLEDTYTITYNDGSADAFTVTNGEKGDPGQDWYVHIQYAAQEPSESSHDFGDAPDDWMGVYSGTSQTPPADYRAYQWYKIKGETGDTGAPATLEQGETVWQVSDSGTIYPSGVWLATVPVVAPGKYLWSRTTLRFNTGEPVVSYSVARFGIDGSGAVSTVSGIAPDENGNVALTAGDVGALPLSGGAMTGGLNMQGQPLTGLNEPVSDTDAARKGYVDAAVAGVTVVTDPTLTIPGAPADAKAAGDRLATYVRPNLLDNWYFGNPVNQRMVSGTISAAGYFIDRWKLVSGTVQLTDTGLILNGTMEQLREQAIGQSVTASVLTTTGVMAGEYDDAAKTFTVTAAGQTILAAKLELGDGQTLAHPDGEGSWVLNEIPKYSEQLLGCQRYLVIMGNPVYFFVSALYVQMNSLTVYIPVPVPMRANPSVTVMDGGRFYVYRPNVITDFVYQAATISGHIRIILTKENHGATINNAVIVDKVMFSAEL